MDGLLRSVRVVILFMNLHVKDVLLAGHLLLYQKPTHPWHYWILHPAELFKAEPLPEPVKDYSEIHNPLCGIQYTEQVEGMELTAKVHEPEDDSDTRKCIDVEIGPAGLGRTEFITEGWKRVNQKSDAREMNKRIRAGRIEFRPQLVEDVESMFNIDGEEFECMPIRIDLLTDHLFFFCKPG